MNHIHQLLLELGKEQALKAAERPAVEAAAGYMADETSEIGYIYSGWAQSALPHKRLPDDAHWEYSSKSVALIVQPGLRPLPQGGVVKVGVPYGSRARLILIYLQSEALRTGNRYVELGRSLRVWLGKLGIPIGGKSIAEVRDQAERISLCRMTFHITVGKQRGLSNQLILDAAMFDDTEEKGPRMAEYALLSESFFEQLQRHPMPVAEAAVRQLANNSVALDVYCWLAYRLHGLTEVKRISWPALHFQFGKGVSQLFHFKANFRRTLELTLAVYPEAKVVMTEQGVELHPSPPPINRLNASLGIARVHTPGPGRKSPHPGERSTESTLKGTSPLIGRNQPKQGAGIGRPRSVRSTESTLPDPAPSTESTPS